MNHFKKVVTLIMTTAISFSTTSAFVWAQEATTQPIKEEPLTAEDFKQIEEVYNSIINYYIEDVEKEVLLQGALDGMVSALEDPYSEYLDADEAMQFDDTVEGSFFGIGIQIMSQSGQIIIISPINDTPAEKAGLQANDIILEADGISLTDMNTNEVVKHIRGEEGTTVNLKIQRGSQTFEVTVERAEIPIISVTGEVDEQHSDIGFVQISQFSSKTAEELKKTIEDLRADGVNKFVFDLRNNPGGLLDQAMIISNMFLENNDIMVQMQEQQNEPRAYVANDAAYGTFQVTEPYVVLINEGSASASEILAAAISENTEHLLIGKTTFGKGTAQNITNQSDLGELKLTIAKWLTPNGNWIHQTGITPHVEVEPNELATAISLSSNETLQEGDVNEFVKTAIKILNALGFETDTEYAYDESVKVAVEAFQKGNDLEVDGKITGDTATKLNLAARDYLLENDPQYDKAVETLLKETAN